MMNRLGPLEEEKALGGAPRKSELRRDQEPWSHLEKKGSSVPLLQGLLQLLHIALQLQVLIPGVFHLLLAKETRPILSRPRPQKPPCTPVLLTTAGLARGRGEGSPAGLLGPAW